MAASRPDRVVGDQMPPEMRPRGGGRNRLSSAMFILLSGRTRGYRLKAVIEANETIGSVKTCLLQHGP
jgi:hypothetical protein